MNRDLAAFERVGRRHDFLCRHPPRCMFCDAEQVQLTRIDVPAEWKCRICKRRFEDEPQAEGQEQGK
jgi:ribosomal protein L37AE/L43A